METQGNDSRVRFEEEKISFSQPAPEQRTGMTASLARSLKVSAPIASALLGAIAVLMLIAAWYFYSQSQPKEKPRTQVQIRQLEESMRPPNQR